MEVVCKFFLDQFGYGYYHAMFPVATILMVQHVKFDFVKRGDVAVVLRGLFAKKKLLFLIVLLIFLSLLL